MCTLLHPDKAQYDAVDDGSINLPFQSISKAYSGNAFTNS